MEKMNEGHSSISILFLYTINVSVSVVLAVTLLKVGRLNDFLMLLRSLCTIAHWKGLVQKVSKLVSFVLLGPVTNASPGERSP